MVELCSYVFSVWVVCVVECGSGVLECGGMWCGVWMEVWG